MRLVLAECFESNLVIENRQDKSSVKEGLCKSLLGVSGDLFQFHEEYLALQWEFHLKPLLFAFMVSLTVYYAAGER
jgi:hypothetical protein